MANLFIFKTSEMKVFPKDCPSISYDHVNSIISYDLMSSDFKEKYSSEDYPILLFDKDNYKEVIGTFNMNRSTDELFAIEIIDDAGIEEPLVDINAINKALAMYE